MSEKDIIQTCGLQLPWQGVEKRKGLKILQKFADVRFSLFLFSATLLLYHCVLNGLYGMSLSTIEQRFQLKSTEMGLIGAFFSFSMIVGLVLLVFFGENHNRPMWIGQGTFLMGLGCIIFILPHYVAPQYVPIEETHTILCQNKTNVNCSTSGFLNYFWYFAVALMISGFGSVALLVLGVVYIDENSTKEKSSWYYSIFLACGGLGPMFGFILGGAALELYTYIGQEPDGMTSSSYAWMGAWWLGYLISGIIFFVLSVFIYMLPRNMPGSDELRKNRNDEMQANELRDEELQEIADNVFKSVKYLLKNKCFMLSTAGNVLNFAFIYGFNTFGAKYVESQLGMKPYTASIYYGVCTILAAATSQILSGVIISKFKLTVQQMIIYMIICSVISACCSFGLFIHCPDINFAGATVPYHGSNETGLRSPCNANCTCSTDIYEPVCGSDEITYFSPCFAACSDISDNGTYSDCKCILDSRKSVNRTARPGPCEQSNCDKTFLFLTCVFFAFFTSLMTMLPSLQVCLRCVPFNLRVRGTSLMRVLSYLFGSIPAKAITGYVVDLACAAWLTECGSQGSCAVYNRWEMARNMALILLAETWCMVGVYVAMLFVYEPHGDTTEKNKQEISEKNEEDPMVDSVNPVDAEC